MCVVTADRLLMPQVEGITLLILGVRTTQWPVIGVLYGMVRDIQDLLRKT